MCNHQQKKQEMNHYQCNQYINRLTKNFSFFLILMVCSLMGMMDIDNSTDEMSMTTIRINHHIGSCLVRFRLMGCERKYWECVDNSQLDMLSVDLVHHIDDTGQIEEHLEGAETSLIGATSFDD